MLGTLSGGGGVSNFVWERGVSNFVWGRGC